jgi:hypothetical protein
MRSGLERFESKMRIFFFNYYLNFSIVSVLNVTNGV